MDRGPEAIDDAPTAARVRSQASRVVRHALVAAMLATTIMLAMPR